MTESNSSSVEAKCKTTDEGAKFSVAEPHDLSPRAKWLRDYYFMGNNREWYNEYMPFTTGAPWGDRIWHESDFYIVPDVYAFIGDKTRGFLRKN